MNSVFSEQILADKLSKVNSTQQCIETLSHWCIFHRSKAEVVVATWEKQFHSLEMAQKIPLLYLANDILQNSKRNGNEFVAEFWKVLPAALKELLGEGDARGKTVVSRLVGIWEERRVFGSRARNLKDVMLGEEAPPPLELNGNKKRERSVKIVKRDSRSIRTKLSVGGMAEKIVSAFHVVLGEQVNESSEMGKCKASVKHIRKMEKDVDIACSSAKDPKRKTLAKELEEEEHTLKQCVEKLKSVEASRLALISQLKDALNEQESELENVRTQMQVAQAQAEEAVNMRKRLEDEDYVPKPSSLSTDSNAVVSGPKKSTATIAAEVADKLTASTSSQLIMASVLSTFAAEAAKNAASSSMDSAPKPMAAPPSTYQSVMIPQATMQNQAPSPQVQYHMLSNPPGQQYLHPYGYSGMQAMPPAPPPHMVSPMVPLAQPPMTLAPPMPLPLQPPGMMYYGHSHRSQ